MKLLPTFSSHNKIILTLLLLLVFRLYFNAQIPLMDKTEARYAEIARIMEETNNWIVPQIDYNIPFWAKPPYSHSKSGHIIQGIEIPVLLRADYLPRLFRQF